MVQSTFWAVVSGILITVMTQLNAALGQGIGVLQSCWVVHLVGTLLSLFLILPWTRSLRRVRHAPWFILTGGLLGVFVVIFANVSVAALGIAATVSIFITSNLFFSILADQWGWFGLTHYRMTRRRAMGLSISIAGLLLLLWRR